MIPKKIHYIWFWKWKKPEKFQFLLNSWKKYCPDYEIIEWNEDNYDIEKNPYLKKYYDKRDFAFASDYARFDIIYKHWGIYLDTDVEITKNFDDLLENKAFTWFQDIFYIGWAVFWAEKWHETIKKMLDFYEKRNKKIIITFVFKKFLKEIWLKKYNSENQFLKNFTVYKKEYFYPYAFFEDKQKDMKITENTYTIHHFDATWMPKIVFQITNIFFKTLTKILLKLK